MRNSCKIFLSSQNKFAIFTKVTQFKLPIAKASLKSKMKISIFVVVLLCELQTLRSVNAGFQIPMIRALRASTEGVAKGGGNRTHVR